MTRRKKTDGEKVTNATDGLDLVGKHYLAARIDRLIRKRMAEAWEEGWELGTKYGDLAINRYRGRKRK